MWQLHLGTAGWLAALARSTTEISEIAEFDVSDCFLNTSRSAAIPAVGFWMNKLRRRGCLFFSISKDSKDADYLGKSASPHFWSFSSVELLTVVEWELSHNDLFECVGALTERPFVLQQVAGLPMGGHLSAALVELVALQRELLEPWPPLLCGLPTARYRDNFFVACPQPRLAELLNHGAAALTLLLAMPVKLEGSGSQRRMLEVVLSAGTPVKAVLAFRDDPDRQGESGDVVSWPGLAAVPAAAAFSAVGAGSKDSAVPHGWYRWLHSVLEESVRLCEAARVPVEALAAGARSCCAEARCCFLDAAAAAALRC